MFAARPRRHNRQKSQDVKRSKSHTPVVVATGDIFTSETPRAYAPLGYSVPEGPSVLRPEDFANEGRLPEYPPRPPQAIIKPLGPTFVDTESQRQNAPVMGRKLIPRDASHSTGPGDPIEAIVDTNCQNKKPLMLGKNVISESYLETSTVYLEKILKRERDTTNEPEDSKHAKKPRKDFRIKFEGEEEGDTNEDTVKPENVLRMVDSSLVDTPEKVAGPPLASAHYDQPIPRDEFYRANTTAYKRVGTSGSASGYGSPQRYSDYDYWDRMDRIERDRLERDRMERDRIARLDRERERERFYRPYSSEAKYIRERSVDPYNRPSRGAGGASSAGSSAAVPAGYYDDYFRSAPPSTMYRDFYRDGGRGPAAGGAPASSSGGAYYGPGASASIDKRGARNFDDFPVPDYGPPPVDMFDRRGRASFDRGPRGRRDSSPASTGSGSRRVYDDRERRGRT